MVVMQGNRLATRTGGVNGLPERLCPSQLYRARSHHSHRHSGRRLLDREQAPLVGVNAKYTVKNARMLSPKNSSHRAFFQ